MKEKYMRVELGTGYCGEESVEYYKLSDQTKTEVTPQDWDQYEEMALNHNESYGHEYADYCDDCGLDPDDGDCWDSYVAECCDHGCIEIVEADPDDEDDSTFGDGFIEDWEW